MKKLLIVVFFSSNINTNESESLWDDCDDSIFSELCDTDVLEKVDYDISLVQTNVINDSVILKNTESTTKRKYDAIESNVSSQEKTKEHKKNMIKKLKNNSLFKF